MRCCKEDRTGEVEKGELKPIVFLLRIFNSVVYIQNNSISPPCLFMVCTVWSVLYGLYCMGGNLCTSNRGQSSIHCNYAYTRHI